MTPHDLYNAMGLDPATLDSQRANVMVLKHATRRALYKRGLTDRQIADIEGLILGRYVDRTNVWYSIHQAKEHYDLKRAQSKAMRLSLALR